MLTALGDGSADGRALGDLAATIGADKSTALRLLAALRDFGLVDVDDRKRYHLGVGVLRLGQVFLDRLDVRSCALPALRELASSTGETSHLVLYRHPDVVYVEKVEGDSAVRMRSRVGQVEPAASTGVGRAYLAYAPPDLVDDLLSRGLAQRTPATMTSARRWKAELARIRERGYAIDDCENEAEIRCVAAAILDHLGEPVAAMSVSAQAWRLSRKRAHELGPTVFAAARAVSRRLGAVPPITSTHISPTV
jgi:DNA-binding IclR family transcriptional regulator